MYKFFSYWYFSNELSNYRFLAVLNRQLSESSGDRCVSRPSQRISASRVCSGAGGCGSGFADNDNCRFEYPALARLVDDCLAAATDPVLPGGTAV